MCDYEKYRVIPEKLLKSAYDMRAFGIFEYAWRYIETLEVIKILEKEQIPLLGGDVYKIVGTKVEATSDSWYIAKTESILEGYNKSRNYLHNYKRNNGLNYLYVPVW